MKRPSFVALCAALLVAVVLGGSDVGRALGDGGQPPSTGARYPVRVHRGSTLPPPAQSDPVPLVIGLHPSGGSPESFEASSGLDAVADRNGFVVAYLSAPTPTSPAWTLVDMSANLAYISSEISQLITEQNIDPNRVYVTGFSAGATMAFFVGCQLSSTVDAIAVVSGAMRFSDPCKLAHPVSELLVIGTNDAIPIAGSSVLLSATQVAARWRAMNACTGQSSSAVAGPVTTTTWSSCDDSSAVGLSVIAGGTHRWPGPRATGADTQYDAAEAVWAFFAAHPGTPTNAPTASLSSLTVKHARHKRWVRAVLRVREASVALRLVLSRNGRAVTSQSFKLARRPRNLITLHLPAKTPGGSYSLKLALADAYGRTMTIVRPVHVPS